MQVSVVLCTYDPARYDDFREAADSVIAQSHDETELVIVVDGDERVHEAVLAEYSEHDDVIVHCNDRNRGLSTSRNRGAEQANGDMVVFMDDDAIADPAWLETLVGTYERHEALAVGGRMTPEWVVGRPRFLPAEFYWLVGVTYRGFPTDEREVRNTFSSNLSFRAEVFDALGGFDADMGKRGDNDLQGGETELCARLEREYGSRVWYNPDARVAHKVFAYRTDPRWLLERAFWQGYSKRAMETFVSDSTGTESAFLGRLLGEFLPRRVRGLLARPSMDRAAQLFALVVLTAAVGVGYCYGLIRYSAPLDWGER